MPKVFDHLLMDLSDVEQYLMMFIPTHLSISQGSIFFHREKDWEDKPLEAELHASSALEAILSTAYVDSLAKVQFQALCARRLLKTIRSQIKHERNYCSQPCAH